MVSDVVTVTPCCNAEKPYFVVADATLMSTDLMSKRGWLGFPVRHRLRHVPRAVDHMNNGDMIGRNVIENQIFSKGESMNAFPQIISPSSHTGKPAKQRKFLS